MEIADSARKHRTRTGEPIVSDEDMLHAARNPSYVRDLGDRFLIIGPDLATRDIEVIVLDLPDGPLIIHAMRPPRRQYRRGPT